MKMLGWIPIILFFLLSFRREQLHGLIGLHTHIILAIVKASFICFLVLPVFALYTKYIEEFSLQRPFFQILLFSIVSLAFFQKGWGPLYYEDSIFLMLGVMYLVSFNLLYSNISNLYNKLDILNKKQKFNLFNKYPPTCIDDLIRIKLLFVALTFIPLVGNWYRKFMIGD